MASPKVKTLDQQKAIVEQAAKTLPGPLKAPTATEQALALQKAGGNLAFQKYIDQGYWQPVDPLAAGPVQVESLGQLQATDVVKMSNTGPKTIAKPNAAKSGTKGTAKSGAKAKSGSKAATQEVNKYAPIPLPPESGDSRWLLNLKEQVDFVQYSPEVNSKAAARRGPVGFEPRVGGGIVTYGARTYEFDANRNLVRASSTSLSLGVRDPVMYANVPGIQAGEDFGHLLRIDFGHIDAQLGRYGGGPQIAYMNRDTGQGIVPLWYNAENEALRAALQLKDAGKPYLVEATARGHVDGRWAESKIAVYSGSTKVYESAWIPNPTVGAPVPAAALGGQSAGAAGAVKSAPATAAKAAPGQAAVNTPYDETAPLKVAPSADQKPAIAPKPTGPTNRVPDPARQKEVAHAEGVQQANQQYAGAVGGAAFMIQSGIMSVRQQQEWDKAGEEYERLRPTIEKLKRQGEWVFVYAVMDVPEAVDLAGEVAGYREERDIERFVMLGIQHGPSREEALNPPATGPTMSAMTQEEYEHALRAPAPPKEGRKWREYKYAELPGYKDPKLQQNADTMARLRQRSRDGMSGTFRSAGLSRALDVKFSGNEIQVSALDDLDGRRYEFSVEVWDPTTGLLKGTFVKASTGETIASTMLIRDDGTIVESFQSVVSPGPEAARSAVWARY